MRPIPDELLFRGGASAFRRLTAGDLRHLSEADYDNLIIEQSRPIADALRNQGLIAPNSELRLIAPQGTRGQFRNMDVLFAEVHRDSKEFVRLVLFEDKLLKNPEQRRHVLAQLFDYELDLVSGDGRRALHGWLRAEDADWCAANWPSIDASLSEQDILLIIAGDEINARLVDLVRHHVQKFSPLNRTRFGLMSISLFQREATGETLVIPQIVGAVQTIIPPLQITVVVKQEGSAGLTPLAADVSMSEDAKVPAAGHSGRWTYDEFVAQLRSVRPTTLPLFEHLVKWSRDRGLSESWGAGRSTGNWYADSGGRPGLLSVNSKGQVELSFGLLRDNHRDEYLNPDARLNVLKRVSSIWGVEVTPKSIDSWKSLPLEGLLVEDRLNAFLKLMDEVYDVRQP